MRVMGIDELVGKKVLQPRGPGAVPERFRGKLRSLRQGAVFIDVVLVWASESAVQREARRGDQNSKDMDDQQKI